MDSIFFSHSWFLRVVNVALSWWHWPRESFLGLSGHARVCMSMVKKKHRRNSYRTVMPPFESTFVPIR